MTDYDTDIAEARQLIRDLAVVEPKNPGDAKFIQTWASYLDHAGDQAVIGRYRLHNLRTVAASYGIGDHADHADLRSQVQNRGPLYGAAFGSTTQFRWWG